MEEQQTSIDSEKKGFFKMSKSEQIRTIVIFVLICIIMIVFLIYYPTDGISVSTKVRTKMEQADSGTTGWNTDTFEDSATTMEGMEYFLEKTGVSPYLYMLSDEEKQAGSYLFDATGAEQKYSELFTDEQHFICLYYPGAEMMYFCYAGEKAATVIDQEAMTIFGQLLKKNHLDNEKTIGQTLEATYRETTDRIMKQDSKIFLFIGMIALIALFCIIGAKRNRRIGNHFRTGLF